MARKSNIAAITRIEERIFLVRGQRVMFDFDLAGELAIKPGELEARVTGHDEAIQELFEAIRHLVSSPAEKKAEIGFHIRETAPVYKVGPRKRF
ncbi:MAG TPA: hypothetical protein VEH04_04380 [Verrucomicrobiae bacterium]|nr:hypothetical protein [Verrucomicrobiae bacterium]